MTHMLHKLPNRRDEAWKWSDVSRVVSDDAKGAETAAPLQIFVPEGVTVTRTDGETAANDTTLLKLVSEYAGQVWNIVVPDGLASENPIQIEGLTHGHAQISLTIGKGAKIQLVEHYDGQAGAFVNSHMNIKLGETAVLDRVIVQTDPEDCVRIATTHVTAWANSEIRQHTLAFGGKLSRLETRMAGMGDAVKATINGAYLLDGKRHCDMTSYIDLACPNGHIRQSVKGVTAGKSRGVFQGKFHVRRPAQHTDAEMRHDSIMLSDTSEIRSKPELEIYADDVACAHGNTIGALDESALFYMRQRGIPLAQARAILTEAFLGSVFDTLEDEVMRESLLDKLRGWLA
ncbi:Fe-S cluster assembly protein SufD [Litorimonas cladophorae]|uniref:Fe-S cluster assembly protein SufD n=1 Tax=Litorimonas cladophorae TaxID=1220491 RepID=A0A918KD46_9PROT|nr:Fe-S cluster assembly protein SufD [Litorimonas cladophorae]GGX59164.1 Fe-S cluster assembly protein SufD [Litorimonas cladophorae]